MMKSIVIACVGMMLAASAGISQLKSQLDQRPAPSETLLRPASGIGSLIGFLNSDNFLMRHNFSFSYVSSGGQGISLANYTNSMFYKISDPLNVRFDVTLQGSPFGQYGALQQSAFSGVYLSRAELNYQPWDNVAVQLQYRQLPLGYYGYYESPFSHYYPSNWSAWREE